jgi:hypothetical protein
MIVAQSNPSKATFTCQEENFIAVRWKEGEDKIVL